MPYDIQPGPPTSSMTRKSFLRGLTALGVAPLVPDVIAPVAHASESASADFTVVRQGRSADVYVDLADDPAVVRAAGDLQSDIERVSGVRPRLVHAIPEQTTDLIMVGTLGKSPAIDRLVWERRLDVSQVEGRWEASLTQAVDHPVQQVGRALVIAGSDRRGTIYGIYDTSERLGVSPWYWWADVPVARRTDLTLPAGPFVRSEPRVRYRGIFINDEQNLTTWSHRTQEPDKNIGPETYKRIFELLLRLKANYLWPAMHPYSDFFNKHRDNPKLADEYGIVVGSSHPEALLRNGVHEWEPWAEEHRNGDGSLPEYDYTVNPETISDYWRTRARQNASYESSWTIGMRGLHDSGLQTRYATTIPEKVVVMNNIIDDQRKILTEEVGSAAQPQIFIPYKEVLELYNAGVQVPDDVTLIWPDDNHGNMRQLPDEAEQQRAGGNGIYYHLSYWGSPRSYLWLDTTQTAKIWQELRRLYEHRVDRMWIFNVGDLKSIENGLSFCMDMAWDIDRWSASNIEQRMAEWAGRQFGQRHGKEIASIRTEYYRLAAARRPEFSDTGTFSVTQHGDEFGSRTAAYKDLLQRAQKLGAQLPAAYRDAYYELVEYPIHGAFLMNQKYYFAELNALAKRQGRGAGTNHYADLAEGTHTEEAAITHRYNTQIADGKWDGFINPYPTQIPKAPGKPRVSRIERLETSGLGLAAEGNETGAARPLSFSSYTRNRRFIDVFNTGFVEFNWTATADQPWVSLTSDHGTVTDQQRIWVAIDWQEVPEGATEATITFTGAGESQSALVEVLNAGDKARERARGYVEALGYVSIVAAHFDDHVAREDARWQTVAGLGRQAAAVHTVPSTAASFTEDIAGRAPALNYRVRFTTTGTFPIAVFRLPSLDQRGHRRVAIALDSQPVTVLSGESEASGSDWSRNVVEGVEKLTGTVTVSEPGEHTLTLYMVDPAIGVEHIVVTTGDLPSTYLAPPESYHPRYNADPDAGVSLEAPTT